MVSRGLFFILLGVFSLFIGGCTSTSKSSKIYVPTDMPEICHGIDFRVDVQMRKICGVKTRKYRSYKNHPQYRILLRPKNGKLIKKGKRLELRIPQMLPISLPTSFEDKINFSETFRRRFIKSKWDYLEFIDPASKKRMKVMKIVIPFDNSPSSGEVCYHILTKKRTKTKIQRGYASELDELPCEDFERLKASKK